MTADYSKHVTTTLTKTHPNPRSSLCVGADFGIDTTAPRESLYGAGYHRWSFPVSSTPEHRERHAESSPTQPNTDCSSLSIPGNSRYTRTAERPHIRLATSEVVIVEATPRSPVLRLATVTAQLGRTVYAVPAPIISLSSAGMNLLLQQGARAVASPPGLATQLELSTTSTPLPEHHTTGLRHSGSTDGNG